MNEERGRFYRRTDPMTKWKLVPVEPTRKMVAAALISGEDYTAMLSASPAPGEDVVETWARAIYQKMDPQNTDPWDEGMARSKRHGIPPPPMIGNALAYARAVLKALEG